MGAFRSTPPAILARESGLTPARPLLDYRQARFTHRLQVRPQNGEGPEEILTIEGEAVVQRLRAASGTRPGETVEPQLWSQGRTFPGQVYIDKEKPALETARGWRGRDTVWTGGSRFDSGEVGPACVWGNGEDWKGSRYHLGTNKEVFDAEAFAIYQALKACERG